MTETGNVKMINKVIMTFRADNEKLLSGIMELIYFFRGALSYEEAMRMGPEEREIAIKFINKRLEAASKSMFPIY